MHSSLQYMLVAQLLRIVAVITLVHQVLILNKCQTFLRDEKSCSYYKRRDKSSEKLEKKNIGEAKSEKDEEKRIFDMLGALALLLKGKCHFFLLLINH